MRSFLLCFLLIAGASNKYNSESEEYDEEEIYEPAPIPLRHKKNKMKATAHLRLPSEEKSVDDTKSDEITTVGPDHREILFYALGLIAQQKSYINDAQDECDRLIETGHSMKIPSKLLDETEQLLQKATNEILDMFKLGIFPGNLVTPVNNETVSNFSSNLKKLQTFFGNYNKTLSSRAKEGVEIIRKSLKLAERNLGNLRIDYRLSKPYQYDRNFDK